MNSILKATLTMVAFIATSLHAREIVNSKTGVVERSIVIVTASYNNSNWYQWNLDSIFAQEYENYRLMYVDDASSDGTGEKVKQYIVDHNQEQRSTVIINKNRCGALANQYCVIHACKDDDIIIIVDGDDALAHPHVLSHINKVYADPNVWLTYGQFKELSNGNVGFCKQMPDCVITNNTFRGFTDQPSHLRTFYAGLFKRIELEDLLYKNYFFMMTGDLAAMMPMIEMAGHRFKFIPEVLYIYNDRNEINDHKVSGKLQAQMSDEIRARRKYHKLDTLF